MQSIYKYINEKLSLNKQSQLKQNNKFNIDIDNTVNFTKKEIDMIVNFFKNTNTKPYEISNKSHTNDNENRRKELYIHYKSIYTKNDNDDLSDSYIYITKHPDNNTVRASAIWPTYYNLHTGYDHSFLYVSLDKLINECLPKLLKNENFIKSLKDK